MSISYVIPCDHSACKHSAQHKIAAVWSDSLTSELKTYSLVCEDCLESAFQASQKRHSTCRLAKHETLGELGIYELIPEQGTENRKRRTDLENQIST